MAKSKSDTRNHAKLPSLPKNARITKRPLQHPPIPSPRAGSYLPKVVYISSNTPFISTIKRVRKLLAEIDKRAMGPIDLSNKSQSDKKRLETIGQVSSHDKDGRGEEVFIKGTGRAIERVLQVGLYFMGQDDCLVRVRTGSVGTVDDIRVENTAASSDGGEQDIDVPQARVRMTSTIEVVVSLR